MSALADFDLFWPEPPFEVEVRDYGPCFAVRYRTWAEFSTAYRARWQQWPQWSAWLLYRHLIGN